MQGLSYAVNTAVEAEDNLILLKLDFLRFCFVAVAEDFIDSCAICCLEDHAAYLCLLRRVRHFVKVDDLDLADHFPGFDLSKAYQLLLVIFRALHEIALDVITQL